MARRLPQGDALRTRAETLGVSLQHLEDPRWGAVDEPELQRRVMEAERQRRDARLWLIALVSSVAAVASAVAAWVAVSR